MKKFEEKTISRNDIFKGKVIKVACDKVKLPSGMEASRELVFHNGAVGILPVTKDGKICLVRQYRKACEEALWGIPAGKIELNETNTLSTAKRELEEEIQMTGDFEFLTSFYTSPGFCNEKITLYKATNLKKVTNPRPMDEDENLEIKFFNINELPKIIDAKTLIAINYLSKE